MEIVELYQINKSSTLQLSQYMLQRKTEKLTVLTQRSNYYCIAEQIEFNCTEDI